MVSWAISSYLDILSNVLMGICIEVFVWTYVFISGWYKCMLSLMDTVMFLQEAIPFTFLLVMFEEYSELHIIISI
jgi:hypothetical protein